jgi:hypothetical protein
VILFQIDPPGIAIEPFEGDAPGAVDMDGITNRLAAQSMEIEARDIHILRPFGPVKLDQPGTTSIRQIGAEPARIVTHEQIAQPLVLETTNHG